MCEFKDFSSRIMHVFRSYRGVISEMELINITLFDLTVKFFVENINMSELNEQEAKAAFELSRAYNVNSFDESIIETLVKESSVIVEKYDVPKNIFKELNDRKSENGYKQAFFEIKSCVDKVVVKNSSEYYVLAKELISKIAECGGRTGISLYASSEQLSEILCILADVEDANDVLDPMAGCGISSLMCTYGKRCKVVCEDVNLFAVRTLSMLYILAGVTNFEILRDDFVNGFENKTFDKIIVDMPQGIKMDLQQTAGNDCWSNITLRKEAELRFIANMIDLMKNEQSRIVTTVSHGFLNNTRSEVFRMELLNRKLVNKVIVLPSLYTASVNPTIVLVLEENSKDVLFVDARPMLIKIGKKDYKFTSDRKELFKSIIRNRTIDPEYNILYGKNIVKAVDYDTIAKKNGNLNPESYLVEERIIVKRGMDEIDIELKACYERLDDLNSKTKSISAKF